MIFPLTSLSKGQECLKKSNVGCYVAEAVEINNLEIPSFIIEPVTQSK